MKGNVWTKIHKSIRSSCSFSAEPQIPVASNKDDVVNEPAESWF